MTPRQAIKRLTEASLTPLAWEIDKVAAIAEAGDRLSALRLRKIPAMINALTVRAEREVYTDRVTKACGFSAKAVEDLLEMSVDLRRGLGERWADLRKADAHELSCHIFHWFENGAGGKFFKTSDGKARLFYHGKHYEISPSDDSFNGLMYRMTRLAAIEKPGPLLWYYLKMKCLEEGEPIDMVSWLFTDRERDVVYLNLNSPHNKILRIAPGEEPTLMENGTNEHSVLLSSSPQMREFQYNPNASEAEGFAALKSLLMDTTPSEGPQRYFYLCWLLTTFLLDFQGDRGLLQVIASSKIGKSKVGERSSQLLYGSNYVGSGTGPADVRIATSNPICFLDNIENRNLTQTRVDFMLLLANSAVKPKSKAGSDTEVLYQRLQSMGFITSIEAFPGKYPELLNRTFPLMLEKRYMLHGYMHNEIMRAILKKRNIILSAILKMFSRVVLPRLEERSDWSKHLATVHAGHNKDRMNEHLSMILLVLEGILEHIPWRPDTPIKKQSSELLAKWISYQEEQAHQTAITSNDLVTIMDGLAKEVMIKIRGHENLNYQPKKGFDCNVLIFNDPEYRETFYLTEEIEEDSDDPALGFKITVQRLNFIMSAADLWRLFNKYCAHEHTRNPFENPTALGSRLANDKDTMEAGEWKYHTGKDRLQYKKVMGHWHWRLSMRFPIND